MKTLLIALIISLMAGVSHAWDDPCTVQDMSFLMSGEYVLMNFTDDNTGFAPRPDCAGEVTVLLPDDTECVLPYSGDGEVLIVGNTINDLVFKLIDDRLIQQNDTEWGTVLARYGCTGATCSPEHLNLCTNQTACEVVGGNWCNDVCQAMACPAECPECPECEECNATICPECEDCNAEKPFTCPLVGNTYAMEGLELSGFVCSVGPGCCGACTMTYGDLVSGPIYKASLPFNCRADGIDIAGLPCAVSSSGLLKVLAVDTSSLHCYTVGAKEYCFEEEKPLVVLLNDN